MDTGSLKADDVEYFKRHGVDAELAEIIKQLASAKPADPWKFIAETAAKQIGSAPAAKPEAEVPTKQEEKAKPAVDESAVVACGEKIRSLKEKLKAEGLSGKDINNHEEVKALVAELGALKGPQTATSASKPKAKAKAEAKAKAKEEQVSKQPAKGGGVEVKKGEDVPLWYEQVIKKGELIESYPVKGCFILRPWAYRIWELVMRWLDGEIKKIGVENCYFPMFIPKCYIEAESDHLDDFAPELAWVSKFGNQDLDEPVAIRPTSETAMYAAYANWVQSHRDLPIKLNQWCSVVRWEVKQTTPFLRTREFLWQEGHTAFANRKDAQDEVTNILELYALVYERLFGVPVVRGTKTKAETFPGADYTTTVEAFIPATGRAIQGATSHHLGQNFSKMFDISFQDPNDPTGKAKDFAYQNSWGITQRTLGVMVMVHGDDKGLVLPPQVASLQVVIVAVGVKKDTTDEDKTKLGEVCAEYVKALDGAGIRVRLDDRDYSPGWKFNHWEMKGVPLRIEVGPADVKKGEFVMCKRNLAHLKVEGKVTGSHSNVVADVQRVLDDVQRELYEKALGERDSRMVSIEKWEEFSPNLNQGKLLLVPFCGSKECEESIKEKSKEESAEEESTGGLKMGAKSLCVPHEEKYQKSCSWECIKCGKPVTDQKRTMFGRSY